jgi:hypothetical protein
MNCVEVINYTAMPYILKIRRTILPCVIAMGDSPHGAMVFVSAEIAKASVWRVSVLQALSLRRLRI